MFPNVSSLVDLDLFAAGERHHALIGRDEARDQFLVEAAVAVNHQFVGDLIDSRVAGEGAGRKFRKLQVVIPWQVFADLAELFFDDIVVVDQPFRVGGERFTGTN